MLKQIQHQASIQINGPVTDVFPLFTPKGEEQWVDGWQPTYLYPESGETVTNGVFTTTHHGIETLWITNRYEPENYHANYTNIVPNMVVRRVDVVCEPISDKLTRATIEYTFTALSAVGNEHVATLTAEAYANMMEDWQTALNALF